MNTSEGCSDSMIGDNTYLIPLLVLNITIMRHNKYTHGTTEYRGIFSRYLPWSKISGTAQHNSTPFVQQFLFWLRVLDKAEYSAFESTLNSSIVSYRIVTV